MILLVFAALPLLSDCAAVLACLLALKHPQKGAVIKEVWSEVWLLGLGADLAGILWLFLGVVVIGSMDGPLAGGLRQLARGAFGHPLALLWTLMGAALVGACAYAIEKRALNASDLLTNRERHIAALAIAAVTVPRLFFRL